MAPLIYRRGFFITILECSNICKCYSLNKNDSFNALSNINLYFSSSGLVVILGKSGSGKTTLLNILAGIDKPTTGEVKVFNKSTTKWKEKDICEFREHISSYLFQDYQLIEEETALDNAILPLLISGYTRKNAVKEASILFKKFGFDKSIYSKKIKQLSGGEKQRIALIRALITNPKIIFADEPTGALDKQNALHVCETLKKISEKRLVIVVTHDDELFRKYADRIINISNGIIVSDLTINLVDNGTPYIPNKAKKKDPTEILFSKFIFKKWKRNILPFIALIFSFTFTLLILAFNQRAPIAFDAATDSQLNLGVCKLTHEEVSSVTKSGISIVKQNRPDIEELHSFLEENPYFDASYNFSYLLPEYIDIKCKDYQLEGLSYTPIYSFNNNYIDIDLLSLGGLANDGLNEVMINQEAYQIIKETINEDPLNLYLNFAYIRQVEIRDKSDVINDTFSYLRKAKIVGVVKEIGLLNTPKIYYSYKAFEDYMSQSILNNYSSHLGEDYSWYEYIRDSSDSSEQSSYSYYLFLNSFTDIEKLKAYKNNADSKLVITNSALDLKDALKQVVESMSLGLNVFLFIACFGSLIIVILSAISNFIKDCKNSAIFNMLGCKRSNIFVLYYLETCGIFLLSILSAFIIAIAACNLINLIMVNLTGISQIMTIPILNMFGIKFFLPIICLLSVLILPLLCTYIPISFKGNISLKEQLKSHD